MPSLQPVESVQATVQGGKTRAKERYFETKKGSVHQEDVLVSNIDALNNRVSTYMQ